jgi:tetratricopeptide (TPR) repeat protein
MATYREGQFEDAAALLWRVVQTNDVRREVALAAHVLGHLLANDPDRNQEVVALLEKSVAIGGVVLGSEHPQTLEFQSRLGIAYHAAGDLDRATQLLDETLEAQKRVLGPEHPNTLDTQNMLAFAHQAAGDSDRATQLFEETLAARERVLGPNELETVMSRWNLGNAYMLAGDVTQGEALRAQALKVAQEQFASHPIVADILASLRTG